MKSDFCNICKQQIIPPTGMLIVLWLMLAVSAKTQELVQVGGELEEHTTIYELEITSPVVQVGGELEEHTTWTNEFTYVVIDDLIVPEGIELVIMPGVKVQFDDNRGLFVEQGSLKVLGSYEGEIDTVRFESFSGQQWKGLSFNMVEGENNNIINYASIKGGEIGIKIEESNQVLVSNTSVSGGLTNLELINSSNNLIQYSHFSDNVNVALDIIGTGLGGTSAHNTIEFNKFSGSMATNLRIRFSNSGVCTNNSIRSNIFDGAVYGIFIDNSYVINDDGVVITDNVFLSSDNDFSKYGISTGMDNTLISNNIFWKIESAVELRRGMGFDIERNNFYQNDNGLLVRNFTNNVSIKNNTFTGNLNHVITFQGASGVEMKFNNIMNNELPAGIVRNHTTMDIDVHQNFWGTTDSLTVNDLLWDFYNNESLGRFNFLPLLDLADTLAPVSAPHQVTLQLVRNQTLLKWQTNPEFDIKGYAIYQGFFADYQFAQDPIVVSDTFFLLNGNLTDQVIAVTAFDSAGIGWYQQRDGNESPFAFGILMPYAGADTTICDDVQFYKILESTAPFDYEQLLWRTEGDGTFDDQSSLRPTYSPGEMDILNGSVKLTLIVEQNELRYFDSFDLTLRSSPVVFAGSDIILQPTDSLLLAETEASFFDLLEWTSLGDGVFSNPNQLHPVYYFGQQDITAGEVRLALTASSACGLVSDTMTIYIKGQYAVEGKVLSQNFGVAGAAVVAFTNMADDRMQTAAITRSQADGWYRFDTLYAANYLFYAVQDTIDNHSALPTYYVDKLSWQQAYRLPLEANTYHVELELQQPAVELPQGSGRITGRFELPDALNGLSHYCLPWFADDHASYCDGGLSNVSILLYNDTYEIPMAASLTDETGKFYFENLPFGRYFIVAEIPGYKTAPSSLISLSPDTPDQHEISLYMQEDFKIGVNVPLSQISGIYQPYPNPGRDYIHLMPESHTDEPITIVLYSQQGQEIKQWSFQQSVPGRQLTLYVGDLDAGSYLLQMRMGNKYKTYPILLNR